MDKRGHFNMLAGDIAPRGELLQLDRHPITGHAFPNLFSLRTAKLQALLGISHRECSVVYARMDAVVKNPKGFVDAIADATSVSLQHEDVLLPGRRMGNRFKRVNNVQVTTPDAMSQSDVEFMIENMDLGIEKSFSFEY